MLVNSYCALFFKYYYGNQIEAETAGARGENIFILYFYRTIVVNILTTLLGKRLRNLGSMSDTDKTSSGVHVGCYEMATVGGGKAVEGT